MNVYEIYGIIGVILIVVSYFLLQINKISSNDLKFSLMNFFPTLKNFSPKTNYKKQ